MLEKLVVTPTIRQVLASSSIGLIVSGLLTSWGYPAAALPQMEAPNSTINFTPEQASWFATMPVMMCIPGSVIGSSVCELVGPRRLYLMLTPFLWFSFTAMTAASWSIVQDSGMAEILLLTLRAIQGIVMALLMPSASVYLYEMSDNHLRGTMTSLCDVFSTWGFLLCYIAGCFLTWETIAWVLPLITLFPGYLGMLWSPESPLWLARKGKTIEAESVLKRFRNTSKEVEDDLLAESSVKKVNDFYESLKLFANKPNALAVTASAASTVLKELVGFAVILIYMVHIFDAAGVGLDPKYSSVIVGTVRLTCNSIASMFLHSFRRKVLLVSGNTLACLAALAMGLFFYFQSCGYDVSMLGWLPLTGLATHMFACAAAIGPTTWVMAVEVLPGSVRSVGFGIAMTSFAIAAFVISKTFVNLTLYIGMHGVFWSFAAGAFCYIIATIFFLPETYGKSLKDIEDYWNNKRHVDKKGISV